MTWRVSFTNPTGFPCARRQAGLCLTQSWRWHALPQYRATLHAVQLFTRTSPPSPPSPAPAPAVPSTAWHTSHIRGLHAPPAPPTLAAPSHAAAGEPSGAPIN